MELVERYLQAIGQYLPADSRDDILAELRSELLEQVDARSEEWGRPLDEADVAALLRVHGKPEAIALRYLPQRSLIGPAIFPFYLFTLRRTLPLIIGIYTIANVATLLLSPPTTGLAGHVIRVIFGMIPVLFITAGIITLIFVSIDYARSIPSFKASLEQWDPLKLPALKPRALKPHAVKQKSFTVRVVELVVHCLWFLYVLAIPAHPFLIIGPGVWALRALGITFAPIWSSFYVLVLVTLSSQLCIRVLALRSVEQPWIKLLDLAANLVGIVALSLLAFSRQIILPTSSAVDAQKLADANHGIALVFRLILILSVFGLCSEAWRYLRSVGRMQRASLSSDGY
jgi:hypothetical protein